MDKITAIGLDLAKQIIQVHAIDGLGRVVLRKTVRRERLLALLAQFPRCDRNGSLLGGASLGARALQAWARAADHGGGVRAAVSQEPGGEERCQ